MSSPLSLLDILAEVPDPRHRRGIRYSLDVTLGEDTSRVRRGGAPQVMAALRNTVVRLLDATADNLAAAMRTMSNCFNKALALLGLPQLE
jgi:hypothetical protein